jgi:hypothetical protein
MMNRRVPKARARRRAEEEALLLAELEDALHREWRERQNETGDQDQAESTDDIAWWQDVA